MHDCIVIGVGTMGAAACDCLARRGVNVLGLEQFTIPNTRASHHGRSRMFRIAYYEHPGYVPLLKSAYRGWKDLETRAGVRPFREVGALYLGRRDSELIAGSLDSARRHDLSYRELSRSDIDREYPQFRLPEDHIGILEGQAGYILPELAIEVMSRQAAANGAAILSSQHVETWSAAPGGVKVRTANATHEAKSLIITAGAWTSRLLGSLDIPLTVTRQVMGWVRPADPEPFRARDNGSGGAANANGFPCWGLGHDDGTLHYGFPIMDGEDTLKLALHALGRESDPDCLDRCITPEDEATFRSVLERTLPGAAGPTVRTCICMYANSPDSHFIIDKHPDHANVAFACGFSGHGFKFAPVIGEVLADLAKNGRTDHPIDFLSLRRFR